MLKTLASSSGDECCEGVGVSLRESAVRGARRQRFWKREEEKKGIFIRHMHKYALGGEAAPNSHSTVILQLSFYNTFTYEIQLERFIWEDGKTNGAKSQEVN